MKRETGLNDKMRTEDGVSESIGFVIIFSIVMIGISLILLYGYPMLLKQQSITNVRNMERDMIILQNDLKSLAYKNVPYKETSLQVSGGTLSVYGYENTGYDGGRFTIIVENSSNNKKLIDENLTGHLRYESDTLEDVIVLENGAVLKRQKYLEGSVMLAEPRWYIDNVTHTLVINIIRLSSDTVKSRSGVGTVKMGLDPNPELSYIIENRDDWGGSWTIKVKYEKSSDKEYDFSMAWERYFQSPSLGFVKDGDYYKIPNSQLKKIVVNIYKINVESI